MAAGALTYNPDRLYKGIMGGITARRALATVALGASLVPGANAAFPGRNGVIVYADPEPGGGYRLFTISPTGGRPRLLTPNGGLFPVWSPDGKRLLVEISGQLYVTAARPSTRPREVAPVAYNPSWSPDGRTIVYTKLARRTGLTEAVFSVRADGTGTRRLFELRGVYPNDLSLSPKGDRLVMIAAESLPAYDPSMYIVDIDGRGLRKIVDGSGRSLGGASWSPDGRRLAYVDCPNVVVATADGQAPRRIARLEASCRRALTRWSPDGMQIAYGGESGIAIANADGKGHPRYLTRDFLQYGFDWQPLPAS